MSTTENNDYDDLAAGRDALLIERDGLTALADGLDQNFVDAVGLIHNCQGRVITTGMGKSGHMARKIAATFASTGTPSFFVHPGEASHGDLGMITRDDVLLILSNSGETAELGDIIAHAARAKIPVIGIASRPESKLIEASTVPLLLPDVPEACPNGLAPTTSTTMTLALGDALAVALMARRKFTATDFRQFHPGGKLGNKLMPVRDLMHRGDDLPLVSTDTPLPDVILEMTSKRMGAAGVTDADGYLIGIITDGDLRRLVSPKFDTNKLLALTAHEIMSADPKTIRPDALVAEAIGIMNERKITCLFVMDPVDPAVPTGIIHVHDCLQAGFA
ncbi:MAG: KpsF/GutQ family sugar-phosphate isomerase [Alphaproteobacteria bacterium]